MKISLKYSILLALTAVSSQLSSCKTSSPTSSAKSSPESAESLFLPEGHSCSKWFQTKVIATRVKSSATSSGQANFDTEAASSKVVLSGIHEKYTGKQIAAGTKYSLTSCSVTSDLASKTGLTLIQLSINLSDEQGNAVDTGGLLTVTSSAKTASAAEKSIEDAVRNIFVEPNL